MNHLRLLGIPALLLALAPADARACSLSGFPTVQWPRGAHMIATVQPDTVEAGPGGVRYVVGPGHYGPAVDRAIHGQVVEVERIGGMAARELGPSVKRVVLVPWDYGADCTPTPWARSARWVAPGTRGLFTATLRDRAHWAGGLPTFDVHAAGNDPFPQPDGDYDYDGEPDSLLSIEEYFSVLELLPSIARADSSAEEAFRPLFRWAEAHPELARRYPARGMLSFARGDIAYDRLKSISPPLAGTYRLEARLGDEPARVFFVRTRTRPTTWWDIDPLDMEAVEVDEEREAEGYTILSSGSLSPDSLPVDCGPTRQAAREGYISVLHAPEPGGGGQQWRGKIDAELVAAQFPADSALKRFAGDDFERFGQRSRRGERTETPARFVAAGDGAVRVEQTIRLDDGRTLRISGTRVSTATIAEPE